jgi:hypothetical protein
MPQELFKYEKDLLKHHVRVEGWLPRCRQRLRDIRLSSGKNPRRLRYFTFCAVGAIDVLMLDVANVVRRSDRGFDTVVFFDRTPELVRATQNRIPGATGFIGDFVDIILLEDTAEEAILAGMIDVDDPLRPPATAPDKKLTREIQMRRHQHQEFVKSFPFDVVNLDLEEYLFKPSEGLPGRVTNAFRKISRWQHKSFEVPPKRTPQTLNSFSLMFTTRIGPTNLGNNYLDMLANYLDRNIEAEPSLGQVLTGRTGAADVATLRRDDFDSFFKLALPKVLASILMEEDWHIDPNAGLVTYEFVRTPEGVPPYRMLHLVLDVKRHNPPRELRPPGQQSQEAQNAYNEVVRQVFNGTETLLTEENIDTAALQTSLDHIIARRRKYYPEEEQP